MRKDSGFTILELIITVAIVGVLAAVAVPNYLEWLPDSRLKEAARNIYSDMQYAKLNAVKEHKEWAIVFDPANNKYHVCSDQNTTDTTDNSWALQPNTIVKTVILP